jgi:hypothetical protein
LFGPSERSRTVQSLLDPAAMRFEQLGDPRKLVGHAVLRACAKVQRQGSDRREFIGLLLGEPAVGARLVLALDERRRLRTSVIVSIESVSNATLYLSTTNSRYRVQRLGEYEQETKISKI